MTAELFLERQGMEACSESGEKVRLLGRPVEGGMTAERWAGPIEGAV